MRVCEGKCGYLLWTVIEKWGMWKKTLWLLLYYDNRLIDLRKGDATEPAVLRKKLMSLLPMKGTFCHHLIYFNAGKLIIMNLGLLFIHLHILIITAYLCMIYL